MDILNTKSRITLVWSEIQFGAAIWNI